jgi:hypothetical protein
VGDDARLGDEEAALRLEERPEVGRQRVAGVAARQLGRREVLVDQPMLPAGGEGAGEDGVLRGGGVDGAGDVEQLLAGRRLQLPPEGKGAAQQRHVARVLVVGEADDPGEAVGGAHRVGDVVALQPRTSRPRLARW